MIGVNAMNIRICLAGATGWAGSALSRGIFKAPEMELVESMAEAYVRLTDEAKRVEAELDKAHETLMKYFKATGTEATRRIKE